MSDDEKARIYFLMAGEERNGDLWIDWRPFEGTPEGLDKATTKVTEMNEYSPDNKWRLLRCTLEEVHP